MLSSIQPGWTLRLLQLFWPDLQPRLEFQQQVQKWNTPVTDGLDILHQGSTLAVQEYPLPFVRRTVLEFVLPGDEGVAWWEGLAGLCAGFGLRIRYLDQDAIEELTRWALNPSLEYEYGMADPPLAIPRSQGIPDDKRSFVRKRTNQL